MKSVSVENPNTDIEERISTGQNEKLFLSVQDIVDMTGISTTAVYKLIRSNKIPAVPTKAPQNKKWKPYRVRKEDFDKAVLGDLDVE